MKPSDAVEKYIPEFRDIKVAVREEPADKQTSPRKASKKGLAKVPEHRLVDSDRPVTIHDLLTHTSGISGRSLGKAGKGRSKDATLATWIPIVAEGPLNFQPGTRWGYGGGLDVVARVIEIVSGTPFNDFVQERIFDPLEHEGHPLDRSEGQAASHAGLHRRQSRHAHHLFLRFRRPGQHRPRLSAFRADAGQQGRAVRQSPSQARVGRNDVHRPGR